MTEDLTAFRQRARDWLALNVPKGKAPPEGRESREFALDWQKTQFEGGWAGLAWPVEAGGCGLTVSEQIIWYEEYARAKAPSSLDATFVGLNHAGPTLLVCGAPEQQAKHLPRILRGEVIWCQGFSEPNAGSDLGNVRMRGMIDGEHLVVTGQKIWSSFADIADFQELLVRTDPDARTSAALTWIICPMDLRVSLCDQSGQWPGLKNTAKFSMMKSGFHWQTLLVD